MRQAASDDGSETLEKTNMVLIGFMYSGKTTIGKRIAAVTGRELLDTDSVIESEQEMTISEVFEARQESGFRALEREVVRRATSRDGVVIALGGGAVLDARNVEDARRTGMLFYLKATPAEVAGRADGKGGRPLLEGKGIEETEEMMKAREERYVEAADVVIECGDRDPRGLALEIIADFNNTTTTGRDTGELGG